MGPLHHESSSQITVITYFLQIQCVNRNIFGLRSVQYVHGLELYQLKIHVEKKETTYSLLEYQSSLIT